jgi:MFS family permease
MVSLVFSSGALAFLPASLLIGNAADKRGSDFPWMRRVMISGLLLTVLGYALMGPFPIGSMQVGRAIETVLVGCAGRSSAWTQLACASY